METLVQILARELGKNEKHVASVIDLIDEGNTIPFIARYRKEVHGTMDDTTLRTLSERLTYLRSLSERRAEVKKAVEAQGKLTEELSLAVDEASTLAEIDDLYRPYRQKRRTRATVAKERGLEPLAELILSQNFGSTPLEKLAEGYIDPEKEVLTVQDALSGASDIIAETISDDPASRKSLRELSMKRGQLGSHGSDKEASVYSMYYDFNQPVSRLQGHQILALNRGERENKLKVSLDVDRAAAITILDNKFAVSGSLAEKFVQNTAEDAYDRLLFPSLEREVRNALTETASEGAIRTFALNLKPLLMQPPVKGKVTLGFDPAYRTGCKLAVVDGTGKVLDTCVIYPTPPNNKTEESKAVLKRLIKKYGIEHISIGNGTASRESEEFISGLIGELDSKVSYMIVNEAGASVYSASELGAQEMPEYDVSLRSAVSIARRIQDPLAELVKIDPKAIGVGQYQHDMPKARLDEALGGVVEDCVNAVGVDVNTASPSLLSHISGLSATTAKNIVAYREENGVFTSRAQLLKVPKLGPKAYKQCAGFLRVPESKNILDNTGVHPESYDAAKTLLSLCGYTVKDAMTGSLSSLAETVRKLGEASVAEKCGVGVPTLRDIIKELARPGRDVRDELPPPLLRTSATELSQLAPGTVLHGTVRNVADFGAFVDIGVHQDGLVHISQICDRFIRHPSEVLSVGDIVKVVVLDVDKDRKRISLSIKQAGKA